jgi:hypothetical protein
MRPDENTPATTVRIRPRSRTAPIIVSALVLGIVIVRSPLTLYALVDPFRSTSTSTGATREAAGNVEADVASEVDLAGRDPVGGIALEETDGASDGRWGASPLRPGDSGLLLEEFRGGWRVEAGGEEAAALAVVAAHAWADARLSAPDGSEGSSGGAFVVVEAVERPGTLHAVVTVLIGTGAEVHRLAFPVLFRTEGPILAGDPWPLPAPSPEALTLTGMPVADARLLAAAREALDAVGIASEQLVALEATDGWPFIARLDDEASGHPWLRWHLDRFVVAGLPLHRAGSHQKDRH